MDSRATESRREMGDLSPWPRKRVSNLWIEHHYVIVQSHGKAHPEDVWDEQ